MDRMIDHFKMAPFQHHRVGAVNMDDFAQAGKSDKAEESNENYVEVFGKP